MFSSKRVALAAAAVGIGALAAPATGQAAQSLYGVTQGNRLVQFNSDSPGNIRSSVPISGLASGDQVVGIDIRPATGQLYGLGVGSRIYVIDPTTGVARQIGAEFAPALTGTSFGFDFNPTVDRIRVISDTGQNLRLNPDTGAVAATDGALNSGGASATGVTGSGYTNSVPGATTTTLFDVDTARDQLVTQVPPNEGTLVTVGPLGIDAASATGFDIAPDGTALAALTTTGQTGTNLHRIDLATGRATPAAAAPGIAAGDQLRALAIAGPVADDTTAPSVSLALSSTQLESRLLALGVQATVACDEACTATGTVTLNGQEVGTATAATPGGRAGNARVRITLNETARTALRASGTVLFTTRFTVTDAAGRVTTVSRTVRSQTAAQRAGRR